MPARRRSNHPPRFTTGDSRDGYNPARELTKFSLESVVLAAWLIAWPPGAALLSKLMASPFVLGGGSHQASGHPWGGHDVVMHGVTLQALGGLRVSSGAYRWSLDIRQNMCRTQGEGSRTQIESDPTKH